MKTKWTSKEVKRVLKVIADNKLDSMFKYELFRSRNPRLGLPTAAQMEKAWLENTAEGRKEMKRRIKMLHTLPGYAELAVRS